MLTLVEHQSISSFFKHPKNTHKTLLGRMRVFRARLVIFQFSQQCLECIAPKPSQTFLNSTQKFFSFVDYLMHSFSTPISFILKDFTG